jgi:hypothetical protein
MTELISKDIVDLQDIEKVQFLQALQADPAKYSAYVNDKTNRILAETVDVKRAAFVKAATDMGRMMDMDHNSLAALDRTNDLTSAQSHIIDQQSTQEDARKSNLDLTRRQVEINNWYFEDKRETLFVLQLILLVALTVVMILGGASYGFVSDEGANYLMGLVILVGAGTWLYRWYYTSYVRDPRYWHRRTFEEDAGKGKRPDTEPLCKDPATGAKRSVDE